MIEKLEKLNLNINVKVLLEIGLTFVIFTFMLVNNMSLFKIITLLLSFIIILEAVRMILDFTWDKNHIIKITIIIDGFILFFLRDILIVVSDEKYNHILKIEKLELLVPLTFIFFIFRFLAMRFHERKKIVNL